MFYLERKNSYKQNRNKHRASKIFKENGTQILGRITTLKLKNLGRKIYKCMAQRHV